MFYFILITIFLIVTMFAYEILRKHFYIWLPTYIKNAVMVRKCGIKDGSNGHITHILFCLVDHFEPGTGGVNRIQEIQRVKKWVEMYPEMASKHLDGNGRSPRHTWFFPPHYDRENHLEKLIGLCKAGYGEIEMHLHHDHIPPFPETPNSLKKKIQKCVKDYSRYGIFVTSKGENTDYRYGFIHGDWALDNSRNGKYCGVNNELKILSETGCYADFTFPSLYHESQPSKINSIYYVTDNVKKPKSYDTGTDIKVGSKENGDLMIIQGILGLRWRGRNHWYCPTIEASDISAFASPTTERVDFWVKMSIHVKGRPEWVIIKLHTHGAPERNHEANFGKQADKMFHYLETKYNDKKKYKLHYVSARELFNIIKAAENGEEGDPYQCRDYHIPRYQYIS